MKFIAAVIADLRQSPLGTRSRLAEPIAGVPVLRRCLSRVKAARRIDEVYVVASPEDAQGVQALVEGLGVQLETAQLQAGPFQELVRAGRWWGLDGWRGGVGSLSVFDEDMNLPVLAALAQKHEADAVVCVPGAAALVDGRLIDAMVEHYEKLGHEMNLTFAQAPPGLAPIILGRSLIAEIAPANEPVGLLLAYNPDRPVADLTGKDACYRAPAAVIEAGGRLLCDTSRGVERVGALIAAGADEWNAERIGRYLCEQAASEVLPFPAEIEIELTTDASSSGDSIARPSGDAVGRRGPIKLEVIRSIVDAIGDRDDVRVVLGGFGDPLMHPSFSEVCRMLRPRAAALAVRTFARVESTDAEDALFETPVDVIELPLDATTQQTYQVMHGVDKFADVMARLEQWLERRIRANKARPLVVPSFSKCDANVHEMEEFFDKWQRRLGMSLITGHSDYAGQRPARAVTRTTPPARGICRQTLSRMMILADGSVTTCDQDYRGLQITGRLPEMNLSDAWRSTKIECVRAQKIEGLPLCGACSEWHRP